MKHFALIGTPGVPRSIQTEVGAKFVYIRWLPPEDNGGCIDTILTYTVAVTLGTGPAMLYRATSTSFNVTGLYPGTAYSVSVRANNQLGAGNFAENLSVRTRATCKSMLPYMHSERIYNLFNGMPSLYYK